MRCPQARKLIALYVGPEPGWLRTQDRRALEVHLTSCEACRRDWQESREALRLLQACWPISEDTQALLKKNYQAGRPKAGPRVIPLPTGRRALAGAVAAGLLLAVLGAWAVSSREAAFTEPGRRVAFPGADHPLTITAADGGCLAPGTVIATAAGEIKRLVLNTRHQLMMRGDTCLSCAPLVEDGQAGCLIRLTRGEIFACVEHDGNPFAVQTAQGRAVITGTLFDIKAGPAGTTLAVVEGSVRFESAAGHVQVVADQSSMITATPAWPSVPARCDVNALTAWATSEQNGQQAAPEAALDDLTPDGLLVMLPSHVEVPAELDAPDYSAWVDQRRDWFRQQFPWIFALQEALAREGVQTDYPTLLRQSGEIWQFTYPPRDPGRPVEPRAGALLRAVAAYGRDEPWLKRQGFLRPGVTERAPRAGGPEAFEQWAAALEAQVSTCLPHADSGVLTDTVNACLYLLNTRTLALLSLRHDWQDEAPQTRSEIEGLLQEQLRLLARGIRLACEPDLSRPGLRLCEGSDQLRDLAAEIRSMVPLEKQLAEHEKTIRP